MKKSSLFYILACMTSLFIFSSCEENVDQVVKEQSDTTQEITNRSIDDCEDCPLDDCCCAVWLQPGDMNAELQLCGTSDGPLACIGNAVGNCAGFLGGGQLVDLSSMSPRHLFCMDEGMPFLIRNLSLTDTAKIIISCQIGSFFPDTIHTKIPPLGVIYFETDNSCELGPCL